MAIALFSTGYFMYIDRPETPNAVVICVIIFNAAFGYRWVYVSHIDFCIVLKLWYSWGPLPWLYPPEVSVLRMTTCGHVIYCCRSCL